MALLQINLKQKYKRHKRRTSSKSIEFIPNYIPSALFLVPFKNRFHRNPVSAPAARSCWWCQWTWRPPKRLFSVQEPKLRWTTKRTWRRNNYSNQRKDNNGIKKVKEKQKHTKKVSEDHEKRSKEKRNPVLTQRRKDNCCGSLWGICWKCNFNVYFKGGQRPLLFVQHGYLSTKHATRGSWPYY